MVKNILPFTGSEGVLAPILSLEVNPPKGTDVEAIFKNLENRLGGVGLFNITDCALARMRMAAIPFAAILKNRFGIEPLVNVACRDRNLLALQADLLAAWALGIKHIVAITGDAASVGDQPERKVVFEVNSVGLLNAIATLNSGLDLAGNKLKGAPLFSPGVVVNPNARNAAVEINRLSRKKDSGAEYAISQPVFDETASVEFFRSAGVTGVPILVGLLAFKNAKAAQAVAKIPGIRLPDEMRALIEKADPDKDLSQFFIDNCLRIAKANLGLVAGFHVVTGASTGLALELVRELSHLINEHRAVKEGG